MTTLTIASTRNLSKEVADRATLYGIAKEKNKRHVTISNNLPWRDWQSVGTGVGTRSYLGSVSLKGFESSEGYIITNNMDANIYVGEVANSNTLKNNSILTLGPFSQSFLTTDLPGIIVLAECAGYDFSSTRVNVSADDARFSPLAGLQFKTGSSIDPLLKLRSSWTRYYDKFDLTYNGNPLHVNVTTGDSWISNKLALSGSSSVTVYSEFSCDGATGTGIQTFINDSFPDTGLGNYQVQNSGATNIPAVLGTYYQQFTSSGTSTPTPSIEWAYLPGGAAGVHITMIDILATIAMST